MNTAINPATRRPWSKADRLEQFHCARMIRDIGDQPVEGTVHEIGDRVQSNGEGALPVPKGLGGYVVARWPGMVWESGHPHTDRLEWLYSVRWDDREWNNPGNKPTGISWKQIEEES
jgi:hypothetical protein